MTDLWLHSRIKDLESSGATSGDNAPPGAVATLFGKIERYQNFENYGLTNSNVNGANSDTMWYYGMSLLGAEKSGYNISGTGESNPENFKYKRWLQRDMDWANGAGMSNDSAIFSEDGVHRGYSSSNQYSYPVIGVRMFAVENTTDSNITSSIRSVSSSYSSYSYSSMRMLLPSSLSGGKYTDSSESQLMSYTSNSSTYRQTSITVPANTVAMIFLFSHERYYTQLSYSNSYIFIHTNGFYDFKTFFSNTGLKPRNDFVDAAFKGGIVDGTNQGPENYWNHLVLKEASLPTSHAHLGN